LLEHQRFAVERFLDHARTHLAALPPSERARLVERMDSASVDRTDPEALLRDTTRLFPGGLENLDAEGAVECVRLAARMNPRASEVFALVAEEYLRQERWSEAERVVKDGRRRDPEDRELSRLAEMAKRKRRPGAN
jgi:hypothetical protein